MYPKLADPTRVNIHKFEIDMSDEMSDEKFGNFYLGPKTCYIDLDLYPVPAFNQDIDPGSSGPQAIILTTMPCHFPK